MTIPYLANIGRISVLLTASILSASTFAAHPNDPLSTDEMSDVLKLSTANIIPSKLKLSRSSAMTSKGRTDQEVLLIERKQQKNAPSGQRHAEVYTYDYASNELITSVVDLNTSKVLSSQRKQSVQLPLTENEENNAKDIVMSDATEFQVIKTEFERITSRQLKDLSELNIKAFTFRADSLPNRTNEASKLCGLHRCAQIMMYTSDNVVLEISPIVNLSAGVVTQRIGF